MVSTELNIDHGTTEAIVQKPLNFRTVDQGLVREDEDRRRCLMNMCNFQEKGLLSQFLIGLSNPEKP